MSSIDLAILNDHEGSSHFPHIFTGLAFVCYDDPIDILPMVEIYEAG